MYIFVVPNLSKTDIINRTNIVVSLLLEDGHKVFMPNEVKDTIFIDNVDYVEDENSIDSCDIIIPLGGDGTIIRHASYALQKDIPILGVNLGRVGFLAQLEMSQINKLHMLKDQKPETQPRMVLGVEHIHSDGKTDKYVAINEAVLSIREVTRLVETDVWVDDIKFEHYRADGIIFATPAGSTGYSMSAGGAVADPRLEAMIITPICPYSHQKNSIFLSGDCTVKIVAQEEFGVSVDGAVSFSLKKGDQLKMTKYNKKLQLIKLDGCGYYDTLSIKLRKRG